MQTKFNTAKILKTSPLSKGVRGLLFSGILAVGLCAAAPEGAGAETPTTLISGLSNPFGVASDSTNVYWAEAGGGTVKKVNVNGGTVTALASGLSEPIDIAVDSINVYWTEGSGGTVKKVSINGGSVTTLASGLNYPYRIAIDSTNVYWIEYYGGTVKKVSINGGTVTTLASGLNSPFDIAVDSTNVYWTEYSGGTVKKVSINGGTVTTLASGINNPYSVIVDSTSVYWTALNDNAVKKVSKNGGTVTTLVSGLGAPFIIAGDSTSVYWTEGGGNEAKVKKVSINGGIVTTLASGLSGSRGIAIDSTNVYWTEIDSGTVKKVMKDPTGMGGSVQGDSLNLTSSNSSAATFAGSAGVSGSADGTGSSAKFNNPSGITTDGGDLFVADKNNQTIRKVVISTGETTTIAGSAGVPGTADGTGSSAKFNNPSGITTDGTNVFVADSSNNTVRKVVIYTGETTTIAGSAGVSGTADGTGSSAKFNNPSGITTDGTNVFVADSSNNTVRKVVISTGETTTIAGSAGVSGTADGTGSSAQFNNPSGITTDGTNLFVTDSGNNTVRKVAISTGETTTIAGTAGVSGSADGTGSSAKFNNPSNVTTDGESLFVSDNGNSAIRKVVISTGEVTSGIPYGNSATTDGTNLFATDNGNQTIRKISDVPSYTLTLAKSGTGSGTVTSDAGGINCGSTCSGSYASGATVTLTASVSTGSTFSGWSGGGCSGTGTCVVTMSSAQSVTAQFTLNTYSLSISKSGSGTVTSSPSGVNCGSTCTYSYNYGTSVTLTASPSSGYTFSGWSGGGCSGTGTCTTSITGSTSVMATFTASTYTVSTSAGTGGSISPTSQSVAYNGTTSFTITANSGYSISSVTGCSGTLSGSTYTTGTVTSNCTVTAAFASTGYTLTISKTGTGSGVVANVNGTALISCGTDCSETYSYGTVVILRAYPVKGSTFKAWSGCNFTGPKGKVCYVDMKSSRTVTANFQ